MTPDRSAADRADRAIALSKTISHALRHDPGAYGLTPDERGWVELTELVAALRAADARWSDLREADLIDVVAAGTKRRYEIQGRRIRATYGHSMPARIAQTPAEPPDVLFHGTPPNRVAEILANGLRPMRRQYVHLSPDAGTARTVGRRRSRRPALLEVDAAGAHAAGVTFYATNEPSTWLADPIPARYLRRIG